jgi:hypothetical protein
MCKYKKRRGSDGGDKSGSGYPRFGLASPTSCPQFDRAPNIYSAEPAFPVLADSLLRQTESTEDAAPHSNDTKNHWSWMTGYPVSNHF